MSMLSQAFGADPINKDWNLESTGFASDMASKMWDVGDVHGQQLIRQNFQDATPSLDSMLGVQSATGGSGAIGRQLNQQQMAMSGNQASDAILKSRSMDAQRALAFNRQAMQGEQYTASNEYQQGIDNRMRKADFTNQLGGFAMGGGMGKVGGMLKQAGSSLFGANRMNALQGGLHNMAMQGGLLDFANQGLGNMAGGISQGFNQGMSGIGNAFNQGKLNVGNAFRRAAGVNSQYQGNAGDYLSRIWNQNLGHIGGGGRGQFDYSTLGDNEIIEESVAGNQPLGMGGGL